MYIYKNQSAGLFYRNTTLVYMQKSDDALTTLLKPATDLTKPIHVGQSEPQYKYFYSITNTDRAKPWGGLWTAPASEDEGVITPFTQYDNRALVEPQYEVWKLSPKGNAHILYIDTVAKLEKLPVYQPNWTEQKSYLDYERTFSNPQIDGIHIVGDVTRDKSVTHDIGSWDFTSTIWDSLEWISNTTKLGLVKQYK